jgi:hypothetical protein
VIFRRINFSGLTSALVIGALAGLQVAGTVAHASPALTAVGVVAGAAVGAVGFFIPTHADGSRPGADILNAVAGKVLPQTAADTVRQVLAEGGQIAATETVSAVASVTAPMTSSAPAVPTPPPDKLAALLGVAEQLGLAHLVAKA